jgi:hypothetical protein
MFWSQNIVCALHETSRGPSNRPGRSIGRTPIGNLSASAPRLITADGEITDDGRSLQALQSCAADCTAGANV